MAKDNGRRGGRLLKVGALAGALGVGAVAARRTGIKFPKLPKIPGLADLLAPKRQPALQARTRSPFPSFFRETPQERSRRARFDALKAESAKVSLPGGGRTFIGSFVDLFLKG